MCVYVVDKCMYYVCAHVCMYVYKGAYACMTLCVCMHVRNVRIPTHKRLVCNLSRLQCKISDDSLFLRTIFHCVHVYVDAYTYVHPCVGLEKNKCTVLRHRRLYTPYTHM